MWNSTCDMFGTDVSTLRASGRRVIRFRFLTTPAEDVSTLRARITGDAEFLHVHHGKTGASRENKPYPNTQEISPTHRADWKWFDDEGV